MQQKGFTIIELLVVVAIIAILSSIVLASVLNYIAKAKNAAIKANMANTITHGIIFFSENSGYNNFCNDEKTLYFLDAVNKIINPSVAICSCDTSDCTNATKWCVRAMLIGTVAGKNNYFCVGSAGNKKESTSTNCTNGVCS